MDDKNPVADENTEKEFYQKYCEAYNASREAEAAEKAARGDVLRYNTRTDGQENPEAARQEWKDAEAAAEAAREKRLDMSLTELETAQQEAYQTYFEAYTAIQAAAEKEESAKKEFLKAKLNYKSGRISEEEFEASKQAYNEAKEEAAAEAQEAQAELETAAEVAQAVTDDVEKKKEKLRVGRETDTSFVVHCARAECPYGMRTSYLALGSTHGVMTRQKPQMTIKDILLNTNIIDFGGCHSRENPKVQEALDALNAKIDEERDWRDNVADVFSGISDFCRDLFCTKEKNPVKPGEKQAAEEDLMTECVGECIAQFPADAEWESGHEKVFINGEPVLLRRCQLMCNYGGCITILDSGQPE